MPERIVVHILPKDFNAFKRLMPDDPRLGRTYNDWLQRRADETRGRAKSVTIRPHDFELYCVQLGQVPNYAVLEALAASRSRNAT